MDHAHKTAFLGKDRLFPLLLKMSIPASIGMLVNALYNIVDTIFVGQGVGPLAIAALAIVFPIQMIISSLAQAIGVGASSIVSRRLGEKDPAGAAKVIGTAYRAIIIGTFIMVIILFLFMRQILGFFGASGNTLPYALQYTSIVGIGFFFFGLSMAASSLVRAEGHANVSMIGMLIGAALNCFLDPLFIFVMHWGVKGAAIATVISQLASCIYLFSFYFNKRSHIPIKMIHFKIDVKILHEIFILGTPAFVQSAGMSLLALILNNALLFYGGDAAITAYGMIHRLLSMVILPLIGVAQGFQPIAGYNYGAHHYDRVIAILRIAIITALGFALPAYLLMVSFPQWCIALFTSDKQVISFSAPVLPVIIIFIPLAAVQIIGSTYFQSIGKAIPSFILGLSRQFLFLLPLVLILPLFLGLSGLWYCFPIADLLSTATTLILLFLELRHLRDKHAKQKLINEEIPLLG
jgi:putative MATE family efflux protein